MTNDPAAWVCPNCRASTLTRFCGVCGERPLPPRDLSVRGVTAKVFIALTSIDAQLIRTLRMLFTRPGLLTFT